MQLILYLSHGKRKRMKSRNICHICIKMILVQFSFFWSVSTKITHSIRKHSCRLQFLCVFIRMNTLYVAIRWQTTHFSVRYGILEGPRAIVRWLFSQRMQSATFSCVCFPSFGALLCSNWPWIEYVISHKIGSGEFLVPFPFPSIMRLHHSKWPNTKWRNNKHKNVYDDGQCENGFFSVDLGSRFYSWLLLSRKEWIEQQNFRMLRKTENRYQRNKFEIFQTKDGKLACVGPKCRTVYVDLKFIGISHGELTRDKSRHCHLLVLHFHPHFYLLFLTQTRHNNCKLDK